MKTSHSSKQVIAAFDFDGTITKSDTLLPFLVHCAGTWAAFGKLIPLIPYMIGYLLKRISRQKMKEMVLESFFKGMPYTQFKELGQSFAHSAALKKTIKPLALNRLHWHRKQNHLCVLVSASIDTYLKPWHKFAGFDALICSQTEVCDTNTMTGKLVGLNCWGPEKTRCLLESFGPKENFILYAYGDSQGDRELLALADYPFFKPDWQSLRILHS